ncbi:hypothetical protein VTJ04DRAFT_9899 [Mycothermus thermophilus]|uniref:uncharacterized protein n=1 Tax=Humicola insolens TaxID=85995 RepID=UPI00374277B8
MGNRCGVRNLETASSSSTTSSPSATLEGLLQRYAHQPRARWFLSSVVWYSHPSSPIIGMRKRKSTIPSIKRHACHNYIPIMRRAPKL